MTADSRDMSFEFIKELLNAVLGCRPCPCGGKIIA
jgi:hypothetical protein